MQIFFYEFWDSQSSQFIDIVGKDDEAGSTIWWLGRIRGIASLLRMRSAGYIPTVLPSHSELEILKR